MHDHQPTWGITTNQLDILRGFAMDTTEGQPTGLRLEHFINQGQLKTMRDLARTSEEKDHYLQKLAEVQGLINTMPKTGENDNGEQSKVYLHYFLGGSDWWILEREDTDGKQEQAFGYVRHSWMAENAEYGYVNIAELLSYGVELDLFWDPRPIGEIKREVKP